MTPTKEILPEEFLHESPIHGRSHIHRVMFWTEVLCRSHGLQDILPECLAAARIHDLARTHDGVCYTHGAKATLLIPKYRELFLSWGVKNWGAIENACALHCLPTPLPKDLADWKVAAMLRDADALDRFRLNPHGPRTDWLHFPRTHHFLAHARMLAEQSLDNNTPWELIQSLGERLTSPHKDARLHIPETNQEEPSRERRNRRLLQGHFAEEMKKTVEDLEDHPSHGIHEKVKRLIQELEIITFLPPNALKAFITEKTFRNLWELEKPTWHTQFVRTPEEALDARAYNDERLWGEKGKPLVYAVLIHPEDASTRHQLASNYGAARIRWNPELLAAASFCKNDSQERRFCLPSEVLPEALARYYNQSGKHNPLREEGPLHYLEIQIHQSLKITDAVEIQN